MPKPNALASKYLCLVQTPCAKAFLAVVREGVADKPGDWLCSDSFFSLRFWGLLGSQGEPGFYSFYRDFMERQFVGEKTLFFCLSCSSPIKKPAYFFYENAGLSSCAGDQT